MRVSIFVDERMIKIAIAYQLVYADKPKRMSKKWIKEVVANYISMFGESCKDDHESELEEQDTAKEIFNTYMK
jgi:hypothetical protein